MSQYVMFSKKFFEETLPVHKITKVALWKCQGLVMGEYQYMVPVAGTNKRIIIRSSINGFGQSDPKAQNSIRTFVQYFYKGEWWPLGKTSYTHRTIGWQGRMVEKLRTLYQVALNDSKKALNDSKRSA